MDKRTFPRLKLLLLAGLLLAACAKPSAPTVTAPPATPTAASSAPISTAEPGIPLYKDPDAPIEARVEDLLARMTLAEKIGQMTQVEKGSIRPQDIRDKFIGSLLSGGGGYPDRNSPEGWAEMVDGYQEYALQTRLGIPLIYGVDALHGHAAVRGAVVFPHNIGLGATRDPDLVQRIGRVTALEMEATGIRWNFAPVVAVPQDIRWGRTYEGYSEDTGLVSTLSAAYIHGLQDVSGAPPLGDPTAVLATAKHFVGDGGTAWGSSTTIIFQPYMLDQGVTDVDETTLRAVHLPPYQAAIDAGAASIMVSFSSWGGMKMHAQKYLLTDVLKGEMGFRGFLVSDWQGIDQIPGDYYDDIVTAINAGLDMIMVPYDYDAFISGLTRAVEKGDVSMERIDDAVRRILSVKLRLGLFEQPFSDESLVPSVGSAEHRELAREAVRRSLVLLKNEGDLLPLSKETPLIFVGGQAANDVGMQCGGWTIEWQGKAGNITPGTGILQAIKDTVGQGSTVAYDRNGLFKAYEGQTADVGIAVVGEMPYSEGVGDREDLSLSREDLALIERVKAKSKKLVVILISGRPLLVTDHLADWDALVAAWLPGTEGQGIADLLFGDHPFTGKLPYTWPASADQVPRASVQGKTPLFPFGYGLETKGTGKP